MAKTQYTSAVIHVYSHTELDANGELLTRVFYRIEKILTVKDIASHRLKNETEAEVAEHYDTEEHWLTDYGNLYADRGIAEGDAVTFTVKASRYYPHIKHRDRREPFKARNIEVSTLDKNEAHV